MSWGMPEENRRRFRGFDRRLFSITALLLMISTTFAVNINLNENNSIEFGQGIYQIRACDQFISLEFKSTASVNGFSRVGNIVFKGLDIDKCKGTAMRLRIYKTGESTSLPLYENASKTESGTAVIMVISKTASRATAADDVTLVNNRGVNIEYGDSMQAIDYDPANGNFMVSYAYPLAEMRYVNSVTLESASNI